jgi:DNA processing protein
MAETNVQQAVSGEERATLALFSVEGIGPATLFVIRRELGSLDEALRAKKERLLPLLRDDRTRQRVLELGDLSLLADRCLARADRVGARVLFPGRPEWPRQLRGLEFPPVLYVRGALAPARPRVAIVGSRRADDYGEQLAGFFAAELSSRGVGIVSGGALGVDAAAHREAMGNSGGTLAVLGSGVDVVYPKEHQALLREIATGGGAVVSHFPPGTPALAQNFQVRNRLIAALADAVLVARAGAASGALGTAEAALKLKRPLFAVPGDVTCELACGTNALLESGNARAATGLSPIAEAIGLKGSEWPSAAPPTHGSAARPRARSARTVAPGRRKAADVPAELRAVWAALGSEPVQLDELARRCGLDLARLADALVRLEVVGLCQERLGKLFVRT